MPTGESRVARIAVVVVLAAIAGGWWWKHRRAGDNPATSTVTQPQHGSAAGAPAAPRFPTAELARLTISVTDDKGPLAGATVRLAPRDGDIVVVKTGEDGTAHADQLEPGAWTVSASAPDHAPAAVAARQLSAGADERLALKLTTGGRTLTGTVSDATGGPIAGARIDAAQLTRLARPGDAVSTSFTGADGKYRLSVAEGTLTVAASSPDYAPQSRTIDVGPAGAVADFSLVPGGVIEGVVRDERTKDPVPGARVVARRDTPALLLAETAARRATSGPDGRFRIGGLRPGAWELGATDRTRLSKAPTLVGLGVAEQVSDVELLIGASPVVRGRAVDDTGAPAPRVRVQALARAEGGEATTETTGAFTIEGLRPGKYYLLASSDSYLPAGGTDIALTDKDVDGVIVHVKRGATLKGHVEPRQVCDVSREPGDRDGALMLRMAAVTTAADGEFTLAPVGEGPARLSARCASGDQGTADVTVARTMPDAVVKVAPGGSIAGRVVDATGKPVTGITVMASNVARGERTTITNGRVTSGVQGLTDASGAFKLDGLSAGPYKMSALDRGKPLRPRSPPPTVELAANQHRTGVELAVDLPNGVIAGTVTSGDGKPLPDAWVSAHADLMSMLAPRDGAPSGPGGQGGGMRTMVVENSDDGAGPDTSFPPALTDAQGHYEIRGLPHATYTVVAEAQRGQLRGRATDIQPDATVNLQAVGVTSLSGSVTSRAGPAALFSVELDGPTREQRSFTDGKYSFARVDPGSYIVHVQSADGNAQARLEVKPNDAATLDLTLVSNAVLVGKLVDPAGAPIAGQDVTVVLDTGDGRLQISVEGPPPTTGTDGSFRIEHAAGKVALVVMRPPRPFTRRGLVLEAGKTLDLGTVTVDAPAGGSGQQRNDPRTAMRATR